MGGMRTSQNHHQTLCRWGHPDAPWGGSSALLISRQLLLSGGGGGGLAGGLEAEGAAGLSLRPVRTWLLTSASQASYFRPCKASSSVLLSISGYEAAPPVKTFRIAFYTLASQIFKKFCLEPQKGHTAHAHMNIVRKPLRSLITDYDFWLPDYCTLGRKWLVLA